MFPFQQITVTGVQAENERGAGRWVLGLELESEVEGIKLQAGKLLLINTHRIPLAGLFDNSRIMLAGVSRSFIITIIAWINRNGIIVSALRKIQILVRSVQNCRKHIAGSILIGSKSIIRAGTVWKQEGEVIGTPILKSGKLIFLTCNRLITIFGTAGGIDYGFAVPLNGYTVSVCKLRFIRRFRAGSFHFFFGRRCLAITLCDIRVISAALLRNRHAILCR